MIGGSQQTISNIETEKNIPPADLKVNIAHVFDISIDTLLCQTDEYKPLEYNERLYSLAKKYREIINLLSIMSDDDIERIRLIEQSFVDNDTKNK